MNTPAIAEKEVRFHNALMAFHTLAKEPDAALESAIVVPPDVVQAMETGLRAVADFLEDEASTDFSGAPQLAKSLRSWIDPKSDTRPRNGHVEAQPAAPKLSAMEERHPPVRWKKTKTGNATFWTSNWEGMRLRVERKKTAAGVQFDAFVDGKYVLRSKSSVTSRDRLAIEALRRLA